MFRYYITVLLSLFTVLLSKGQGQYRQLITSFAEINFPSKPISFDTLGIQTYRYSDSIADYLVAVRDMTKLEGFQLKSEDLKDFYKGMEESTIKGDDGQLISKKLFEIDGFKGLDMVYKGSHPDMPELKFKRAIILNGIVISVDFMTSSENEQKTNLARESFFNSFAIIGDKKGLTQETLNPDHSLTNSFAYRLGKLTSYILIVLFVIWIIKKLRRK